MMDKVGLWARRDILGLNAICTEALREPRLAGLLGALEPSRMFSSASDARDAMHSHPIYQWMRQYMPKVLATVPQDNHLGDVRLVQLLLRYITLAHTPISSAVRTDKRRGAAYQAIERVERHLDNGVILLEQLKDETLRNLLAQAKHELASPRPKPPKQAALLGLAHALKRHFGLAEASLLMDIASATGIDCDPRTAQRYVKEARKT